MEKGGIVSDNSGLLLGVAAAALFYYGMERTQWGDGFMATLFAGIALVGGAMSDIGKGQGVLSSLLGKERSKGLQPGPGQFMAHNNLPEVSKGTQVSASEQYTPTSGLPPTLNALKEDKGQGRG
jgi:hypothetical protein